MLFIFFIFSVIFSFVMFEKMTHLVSRQNTLKRKVGFEKEMSINYDKIISENNGKKIYINSSKFKHKIPAIYLKPYESENVVIMVHALGRTKETTLYASKIFLSLGYNVITIDQRNSGENKADYNTLGYLESYDILDTVKYAKQKNPNGKIILWGESNGALSRLIAAGRDSKYIDYLILDCPPSNAKDFVIPIINNIYKKYRINAKFTKFLLNTTLKSRLGYKIEDVDGRNWIQKQQFRF